MQRREFIALLGGATSACPPSWNQPSTQTPALARGPPMLLALADNVID